MGQALSTADPAYYVLLCARRYSETCEKLALCAADDQRGDHLARLRYLLQSGLIEFDRERDRRLRQLPRDVWKALIEKDGSVIERAITSQEAELVRSSYSIPPIASVADLSAVQMRMLADRMEGWAQSDLVDQINVARLLGWADGLRGLVEAVGASYAPPASDLDREKSLLRFLSRD